MRALFLVMQYQIHIFIPFRQTDGNKSLHTSD